MNFFIGLIVFNVLVLGANFCFLLIGGTPWHKGEEFAPIQLGKRTFTVEKFTVGVSTLVLGLSWFITWIYFIVTKWDSFLAQFNSLWLHVALQFLVAIGLTVSGISIFKKWKKSKSIFFSSIGLLIGSVLYALVIHGAIGHGTPVFMYLIAMWTFVIGGFLTTAVFLIDSLMHEQNKNIKPKICKKSQFIIKPSINSINNGEKNV